MVMLAALSELTNELITSGSRSTPSSLPLIASTLKIAQRPHVRICFGICEVHAALVSKGAVGRARARGRANLLDVGSHVP